MSEILLAKLKVKPIPKVQESFEIKIKKPALDKEELVIKTKIVDKTGLQKIKREDFLLGIQDDLNVKQPKYKDFGIKEKSSIKGQDKGQDMDQDIDIPKGRIMENPVKIEKKIKLQEFEDIDIASISKSEVVVSAKKGRLDKKFQAKTIRVLDDDEKGEKGEKGEKDDDGIIPHIEIKIKKQRETKKPIGIALEGPSSLLQIGDTILEKRMGKAEKKILIRAADYYMNNRQIFINFITSLLSPYKKDIERDSKELSCDRSKDAGFSLLTHQKIVRDYMNLYTPYRGLLLYHGLGSGKTCSSIAIAEGLKNDKKVIVMTPASLQTNYVEELKKCADILYKKNQFWEFISTQANAELAENLSYVLSISVDDINSAGGAWLINVTKKPNYEALSSLEKTALDKQINIMIRNKYKFINYNGMRLKDLTNMTINYTINPFDNTTIIIDEAHNFVSRIVNKLKSDKHKKSLSRKLYDYLMEAENVKIILLTGTPIINYPNEIAILFNILRGKIKAYKFKLSISESRTINLETFNEIFKGTRGLYKFMDYIDYSSTSTTLTITKNPFGFISKTTKEKYDGVEFDKQNIDDAEFIRLITRVLSANSISILPKGVIVEEFDALPDNFDEFNGYFVDENNKLKNENLFKRRILGLTSYFPDIAALLPKYEKSMNLHVLKIPMSKFQFNIYEEARVQERKLELDNAKKKKKAGTDVYDDSVSTYRIFSRAFCNFVFPRPTIKRPFPNEEDTIENVINELEDENGDDGPKVDADIIDAVAVDDKENADGLYDLDELDELKEGKVEGKSAKLHEIGEGDEKKQSKSRALTGETYDQRIKIAIQALKKNAGKYLTPEALKIYSPKFLNVLDNIQDPEHRGLHLIYSQFRTLEGIGIISLVLEANGYARFKIAKNLKGEWQINMREEDKGKATFALYTGTESSEEKEILRNIFNGLWEFVPATITQELQKISSNNLYGEIIRVFMITASGAEGISLYNVRYVHIIEPYWHPVRIDQVIGRARRICSHKDLPKELQNIEVFLYLMTFTKEQLKSEDSKELRLRDRSKIDNKTALTSDEALYEISTIKENINKSILKAVKEASIDCTLFSKAGKNENLQCFTFGNPNPSQIAYTPSIGADEKDSTAKINKKEVELEALEIVIEGITFAYDEKTGDVYDYDSYVSKNPVKVGELKIEGDEYKFTRV